MSLDFTFDSFPISSSTESLFVQFPQWQSSDASFRFRVFLPPPARHSLDRHRLEKLARGWEDDEEELDLDEEQITKIVS